MEKNPWFSIIIPVYNTEKELPRCMDSICVQTCGDYEVILVDDGSKDRSGEVCDRLAEKDSRIHVIHKDNGGAAEARNAGIRAASGEFLLFVDSDDMWCDEHALADLLQLTKTKRPDMVCFGVSIFDVNGRLEKIRCPELPDGVGDDKESVAKHLVYTNQYFSASYVKAIRRERFLMSNLFFISGLLSEDIEWSFRVLAECREIAVYPNAFYKRIRRDAGSLTAAISVHNIAAILNSIDDGIAMIKRMDVSEALKDIYYEYWTYQYAMLLGLVRVARGDKSYSEVIARLKGLKWLLKYDHVGKVHAVRILCAMLGICNTIRVLGTYYKIK